MYAHSCPLCGTLDQWILTGILNNAPVMECRNCCHLEYPLDGVMYLDEDRKDIHPRSGFTEIGEVVSDD